MDLFSRKVKLALKYSRKYKSSFHVFHWLYGNLESVFIVSHNVCPDLLACTCYCGEIVFLSDFHQKCYPKLARRLGDG